MTDWVHHTRRRKALGAESKCDVFAAAGGGKEVKVAQEICHVYICTLQISNLHVLNNTTFSVMATYSLQNGGGGVVDQAWCTLLQLA